MIPPKNSILFQIFPGEFWEVFQSQHYIERKWTAACGCCECFCSISRKTSVLDFFCINIANWFSASLLRIDSIRNVFLETWNFLEKFFLGKTLDCSFINPANIYSFKINIRSTRKMCEICSKLKITTPERRHWRYFYSWLWTSKF